MRTFKVISILLIIFSMGSCNRGENYTHREHIYSVVENTATCEEDGYIVSKCIYCNKTKKEVSKATGHSWKTKADTATCLEGGTKTLICYKCEKETQEHSEPLGHTYNEYGLCIRCQKFKYNVKFNLPLTLKVNINDEIVDIFSITSSFFFVEQNQVGIMLGGEVLYQVSSARINFVAYLSEEGSSDSFVFQVRGSTNNYPVGTYNDRLLQMSFFLQEIIDESKQYIIDIPDPGYITLM